MKADPTLQFNPSEEEQGPADHVGEEGIILKVIAHVVGENVEALYVDIAGKRPPAELEEMAAVGMGMVPVSRGVATKRRRRRKKRKKKKKKDLGPLRSSTSSPHITLRAEGASAAESNDLLAQANAATLLCLLERNELHVAGARLRSWWCAAAAGVRHRRESA